MHGDLEVPAAYISPDGLKLGVWIQSVRHNRKKPGKGKPLTERQITALDAIGMNWTGKLDRGFANGMVHAQEYFRANGDLNVTRSCCSPDGFRLGEWVANQRERYRRGSMPAQHKQKMESVAMIPNGLGCSNRWLTMGTKIIILMFLLIMSRIPGSDTGCSSNKAYTAKTVLLHGRQKSFCSWDCFHNLIVLLCDFASPLLSEMEAGAPTKCIASIKSNC